MFLLFIGLEHVKAKWKWNITIERSGIVIGRLIGVKSPPVKIVQCKDSRLNEGNWEENLSDNKNEKYFWKLLKIYERGNFFKKLANY